MTIKRIDVIALGSLSIMLAGCGSSASTAAAPGASPGPGASSVPAVTSIGQRTLVLEGSGIAYDLDAVNTGWKPLSNQAWVTQNIEYEPMANNGKPIILIAGSPYTDVVMTGRGPWTRQDCANAPYGVNSSTTGPNAVTGASFRVGAGICIQTQDTSAKSDGNHIVLLVIKSITSAK
jgi:hypothetical protein